MITKRQILSLIAIAIMTVIVSVACGEKPTDASASASTELQSPVVAVPEKSGTLTTDLPTWETSHIFNPGGSSTPEPTPAPEETKKTGSKADLVGTWSGQYAIFWIDAEGNLNFNNVGMDGQLGYNATYAGYNGKIDETFEYPYSITLVFTPPEKWGLDPKSEKGTFTFTSPTSGCFTGYVVRKVGDYPYGWGRFIENDGAVTKTSNTPY